MPHAPSPRSSVCPQQPGGHRATGLVVFGERNLDGELEADEQGQGFEDDIAIAFDAGEGGRHPVEPQTEAIIQLGRAAPMEPGRKRVDEDGRLGCAGPGGKGLEPLAERLGEEQLMADLLDHGQKSSCRLSGRDEAASTA
ncbi:MAG: hypothetical protein ACTHOJ_16550 [Sphingomonas oligoaromativorans]